VQSFFDGLRLAARALRRNPTFTVAATLTLGLGMGASASIYTLIQRVVLDPLPYPSAERLVRLKNPVPAVGKETEWDMAFAQFYHYQRASAIEKIGVYEQDGVNVATDGDPWRAHLAVITVSMQDLIGARPARGRLLDPRDDVPHAPDVAVLSYATWQARFGGDESIVGRIIKLNDEPAEVVGVMAPGIELPPERGNPLAVRTDLWVAHKLNPAGPFYNNHTHPMIARLAPSATVEAAQMQIDKLLLDLPAAYPQAYGNDGVGRGKFYTVLYPLKPYVLGDVARSLWILFGAVALVLVIACANVGNLLLVRLEARRREFAVRSALGATPGDLARGAFSEGLVLAFASAALALLLSVASTRWLVWRAPAGVPRLDAVAVDGHVVVFTLALSLAIAAGFALVPLLQRRGAGGIAALGDGGRSATTGVERQRLRGALVVTQMALALMLVVGSGLLLESFRRLRAVDPGIDASGVLTLQWFLPYQRYDSLTKIWRFDDAVLSRVRSLPGVTAAGLSDQLPFVAGFGCTVQGFEDRAVYERLRQQHQTTCAGQGFAAPGFFEALKVPLVAGRYFTREDNDAPQRGAVVVTRAFAERFWPGQNPIGQGVNPNGWNKPPFYHVVGVVGDLHGTELDGPPAIGIYYPVVPMIGRFWDASSATLVVRTARGRPLDFVPAIRRAVNEVDPTIPVANAQAMEAIVDRSMARLSFTMTLLGIAGAVALALAAIGLYGLVAYIVARRTNEIGVRIALGARTRQVEGMVVRGALRLAAIGLLIGTVGAATSARVLSGLLYSVAVWDPTAYLAAIGVLTAAAGVAAWIPARRAARVDPAVALRAE
jgi:putative ABC transport system permease protein